MTRKIVLLATLILICMNFANAATYYVSKTGSNSNSGLSWSQAWLDFAHVNDTINYFHGGDTVFIGSGIWRATAINVPPNFTSEFTVYACSSWVTDHRAKIWGSDSIPSNSWTVYDAGNHIYQAPVNLYGNHSTPSVIAFGQRVLRPVSSITGDGQWVDGPGDTIRVRLYAGAYDPSVFDMEAGLRDPISLNRNCDRTQIFGLELAYGRDAGAQVYNPNFGHNPDYVYFDHLKVVGIGQTTQAANPACIRFMGAGTDSSQYGHYCRVRACSLYTALDPRWYGGGAGHGSGIVVYGEHHLLIDSCYIGGYYSGYGIDMKFSSNSQLGTGNVIRYNYIFPDTASQGIFFSAAPYYDSAYGNIINASRIDISAMVTAGSANSSLRGHDIYFFNNTIYNARIGINGAQESSDWFGANNKYAKYNIIFDNNRPSYLRGFQVGQFVGSDLTQDSINWVGVDSNMYYRASGNLSFRLYTTDMNWATWRSHYGGGGPSRTWDMNSVNSNPNFDNYVTFSRSSSPQEMNLTYGGRTWTRYGAWQPDGPPTIYQVISKSSTTTTATLIDDLSGSTAPYDSLVLHWSTVRANVVSLNARDTRITGASDPYTFNKSSLNMSTKYYFRILAYDSGVDGDTSAIDSVTTLSPPAVDQVVTAISTTNSVSLNDNLSGGTVPYDSLVLYWSLTRSNVVNLVARDTLVVSAADPYIFNKASLSSGTKFYFRIKAFDQGAAADTTAIDSISTLIPDTTPPTITGVSATGISSVTANVIWTTNEISTSQVNYGFTTAYGQSTSLDPNLIFSHNVGLSGLQRDTLYHYRVRSRDGAGNEAVSSDFTFRTIDIDDISMNMPDTVSGTYAGYSQAVINDGTINPRGGVATTWASDATSSPHWITVYFSSPKVVQRAQLAWAWNNSSSSWMCSRQYMIQYWDSNAGAYVDAAVINNSSADSVTVTDFAPVSTTRIRYYQPANMGPSNYTVILWITEFTLFGRDANGDVISPAAIQDLNAIPAENEGDILLSWTAPADNGGDADVSYYDIRFLPNVINESNWQGAEIIANTPAPVGRGENQEFVVSDLSPGEIYYIAIKSYDEAGNASSLSNVPFSYAAGIAPPLPASTSPDSSSGLVVVTCETVDSYYSLYYQFELDTSIDFTAPRTEVAILSDSLASASFDQILPDVGYFWRCRAIASTHADTSAWSSVTNFNLYTGVGSILTADDFVSPLQGDVVQSNKPQFVVHCAAEVNAIYIQVDDNLAFSSPISSGAISLSGGYATWQLEQPLPNAGLYYWRASTDNSNWTDPLSFSIVLDIHAYPNPFRAEDGGSGMTFCNLPSDAKLTIATVSGGIVRTVDDVGTTSEWIWDTRNDDGDNVASGVYLFYVSYGGGSSSGKVMVIR